MGSAPVSNGLAPPLTTSPGSIPSLQTGFTWRLLEGGRWGQRQVTQWHIGVLYSSDLVWEGVLTLPYNTGGGIPSLVTVQWSLTDTLHIYSQFIWP